MHSLIISNYSNKSFSLTTMKQILVNQFTMLVLSMVSIMASAGERQMWTDGHGDLQVGYQDGQWDWGVWIGSPVDEVIVSLGDAAKVFIPDNPNFEFLGNSGDPVWIAPQVDREGVIFFGMNSSSTSQGTFERNRFDLRLTSVEGPGDFLMWITGGAGSVEVPLNSRDGIDLADRVDVPAPGHFHQNWGFTSPGTYHVGFTGEGTLAGQSTLTTSDEQLYRFAVNVFDRGELDMEVAYEDGEWELVLLEEANEKEIEAGDAALHAGPATWQAVPSDPAFGFLGNPGDSIYILPQDEKEGILFLGVAGDEIEAGVFENDQVILNLATVDGPGSVYLYSTDAFGAPSKYFDSGDGITGTDQFPVHVGGHSHQNWAFSSPGIYRVGLNVSGVLMDGTQTRSEDTVFLFEVFGPTIFGEGELDLEVAFEDGAWELVGLDDANEREIRAEELVIRGSNATQTVVPEDPAFAFLGSAGDTVNVLPQEETEGVIFLGIAGDEIEAGTFDGDVVQLKLISTDGPGHVSLYAVDAFGSPEVYFNTGDGISESDAFPVNVGGHSHQNWGFTQPGVYRVGLQASGQLVGEANASESEVVQFIFNMLPGDGAQNIRPMVFAAGELDLEVAYEEGAFELVLLDEVNEQEIEASDVLLTGVAGTLEPVPNDPAFAFLGNPGDRIFILPQDEQEGVLFLGIAGDEIPAGEFQDDMVGLNLVGINGPGDVFLYATDAFGAPETFFNSANGIDESDVFPINVGGHSHQNWGFSAAGAYEVILQASGIKTGNGESIASDSVSFFFHVIQPEVFNMGELDMEVAYEDGEWELVLLDEAVEREVEPEEALLQGVSAVIQRVPDHPAFGFLGSAGDAAWVLPQEETEGVLFLGIAGDEIEAGMFENDSVDLQLVNVRGPGDVSLYAVDEFGVPVVYMSSADGIDTNDVFPVNVGGHSHQNWGFTAPGVYKVALQASGTLLDGAEATQSQKVEFTFELLDVPSAILIARSDDGGLMLRWASMPGVNYQLQSRSALNGGDWMNQGDLIPGTGEMMELEVPVMTDVESSFYRLWMVPSETP
jgi:surface-anchored protein